MIRYRTFALSILVGLIGFAVYLPTVNFELINLDDYDYLVRSGITEGFSLASFQWAFKSVENAIWMPLTWLSYAFDFSFGFGWGWMHLHSALIHAINGMLVFILLKQIVNKVGGANSWFLALAGALLWTLHPLRVESVAWLSSRKDVLSLLFELLALVFWCSLWNLKEDTGRFWIVYTFSLMCFCLGGMAKPSVMTFPVLAMTLDIFVNRRIRPWTYLLPGIIMASLALSAAYIQDCGGATSELGDIPLLYRILNAMSAFGIYLTNTLLPKDLAVQCLIKYPEMPRGMLIGTCLSIAATTYIIMMIARFWAKRTVLFIREEGPQAISYRYVGECDLCFAGIFWFCMAIFPFIGIANFGYHAFADRFTYIPAIGLSVFVLGVIVSLKKQQLRIIGLSAVLLGSGVFGWCTTRQVSFWRDDETLWHQTIKVDGDMNATAHLNLGIAAFEFRHDLETSCQELKRVRELSESHYQTCAEVHIFALCEAGRIRDAKDALDWFYGFSQTFARQNSSDFELAPRRLINYEMAEIAYLLCMEETQDVAVQKLNEMTASRRMSRKLAYLWYRAGVLTNNSKLVSKAIVKLQTTPPSDYLQFRFLTSTRSNHE